MQDEIVARLANQLGTELTSAEAHRAERASNPDSMDLFSQGLASLNKGINLENMIHARGYFERALAVDPGNLDALLGVGRVDYSVGGAYLSNDRDARLAAAETAIAKVLSVRPNDALAHEIMGGVLTQTRRADQGIAEFERALALDRNLAAAYGDIGLAKMFVGHPEEAGADENEALRLSPRDSFAWLWLHFAGAAKLNLRAEEEAVALFRRSIENNRTNPLTHFFLAATLANLGKSEEARADAIRDEDGGIVCWIGAKTAVGAPVTSQPLQSGASSQTLDGIGRVARSRRLIGAWVSANYGTGRHPAVTLTMPRSALADPRMLKKKWVNPASASQTVQQSSCGYQIGRAEAFAEALVHWGQHRPRLP
jgi:hypothetical protein